MTRKPLFALMVGTLLVLTACGKDDNDSSSSSATPPPAPTVADEGVYAPSAKIRAINNPDGSSETWFWHGDTLLNIDNANYCGGTEPMMSFGYQEGSLRLNHIVVNRTDLNADMSLYYSGTAIQRALIRVFDEANQSHPVNAQITHNAAGKISKVSLDVANTDLLLLMPIAAQYSNIQLPVEVPDLDPNVISSNSINAHLLWQADNVQRMIVNIEVGVNCTIGDLPVELLQQLVGETIGTYVHTAYADRQLPLSLTACDTIDFSYEAGNINPLYGFIGKVEVSTLSADNVVGQYSHGSMRIQGQVDNIPFVGSYSIDRTMPLPDTTITYSYTYEDQLPFERYDQDGNMTSYVY